MAEDKKPKIDLKSRLQKMGGPGAATPPPPVAAIPAASPSQAPPAPIPIPAPVASRPAPMPGAPVAPPSIPPPSGIPRPPPSVRPTNLDPNNPLSAVAGYRPQPSAPAPAALAAQRIEVDELAVVQARSGARRQGFIGGLVLAVVLAVVAYFAGGAQQQGSDRKKSTQDAHDLATDLGKAKATLDDLKGKLTAGGQTLLGDHKFPVDLGKQLSGIVVDFSGDKLFGRRFSGVPADTLRDLMDFMTRVQAFNNKKDLVVSLLSSTKLKDAITQDLAISAAGQGSPVTLVAVVDKDTPGGACRVASLSTPIKPGDQLPKTLKFLNPINGTNAELPILTDPKIPPTGALIPIVPTSFDKVCPSPAKGAETQLISSMNSLIDDIQGQKGSDDPNNPITEPKPGLSDSAAKLIDSLNKVN
jgi:hypothetical protein